MEQILTQDKFSFRGNYRPPQGWITYHGTTRPDGGLDLKGSVLAGDEHVDAPEGIVHLTAEQWARR